MTKGRSVPSAPRTQKAVKEVAPLAPPKEPVRSRAAAPPSGGTRRPATPSVAKRASLLDPPQGGVGTNSNHRTKTNRAARRRSLLSDSGREQKAPQDRLALQPPAPVLRQARVSSVSFDVQHQAPCVTFQVPQLHRGEQFCRVRTHPPADVRRTRFGARQVELVIYGPLFWRVGDTTTLELEPYGYAAGPRPRKTKRA
jgi:hypothetical protein